MSRAQPEQQPPPVQRVRLRYAKRGRLRFTSHRDFSRAFERAVFRARIPMAYSSGFNPHPRISYAGASPTGAASEAEYLEIALAERVDPQQVLTALADAMPDGLDVLEAVESPGGSFADLLEASRWTIDLDVDAEACETAAKAFLATESVTVERMTKKGLRELDCRAPVVSLAAAARDTGTRIELVMRHVVPAVRPDDVLRGMAEVGGLTTPRAALLTRQAQGLLDAASGTIRDPLRG